MKETITMLSISDIHLGSKLTPTSFIIKNLFKVISDVIKHNNLDIIWLVGDIFDKLLNLPENSVGEIQIWIVSLLRLCKKHDILLRILEGTPSHDRGQSKEFIKLNDLSKINADVKYIDTLYIEHIKKFNIRVLYIPDEYHSSHEITLEEVKSLMDSQGLKQVDYAIMHGMFEYQIPKGINLKTHNAESYLNLVKHYIFIGHVHQSSQYSRILSQGSFDRLAHREEENKGCWLVKSGLKDTASNKVTFIVNSNAMIYNTYSLIGLSEKEINDKLKDLNNIQDGHHVRMLLEKNDPNLALINSFKIKFSNLKWSSKYIKNKDDKISLGSNIDLYNPIPLNANTLSDLVHKRLSAYGIDDSILKNVLELLDEFISGQK